MDREALTQQYLEISNYIQQLLQDESQAIQGYNNFLQTYVTILPAEVIGKIREIISDEKEHLEYLEKVSKIFDGVEANID